MALIQADADEFLRVVDSREIRDNGMSPEDIQRFLRDWLRPKLIWGEKQPIGVYGTGRSGWQSFDMEVRIGRSRLPLSVNVAKTEDGLKVVQPFSTIILTFAALRPDGQPAKNTIDKLHAFIDNSSRLEAALAPYHLSRVQMTPDWDPMTLAEFRQSREAALQKVLSSTR